MLCLSPQSLMTQHLSKLGQARKNEGGRVECATTVIQITKESRSAKEWKLGFAAQRTGDEVE